jgi:hypothetical protein
MSRRSDVGPFISRVMPRRSAVAAVCTLVACMLPVGLAGASEMPSGDQLLESILSAEEVAQLSVSGALPRPASWPERCDNYRNRIMCQRGYVPSVDERLPGVYAISWLTSSEAAQAQFRGEREFDMRHPSSQKVSGASETKSIVFSQANGYPQVEALQVKGRMLVRVRCWGAAGRDSADQIAQCATEALDAQWRKLESQVSAVVPPSVPSFVTVERNPNRADISWMRSEDDGGDARISYVVTSAPEGATCQTSDSECTITGLSNRQEYIFTVVARNSAGESAAASSPLSSRVVVPSRPVRRVKVVPRDGGARVSWTRPKRRSDAPVEYYRVTSRPGARECDTTGLRCDFEGLIPEKKYRFQVVAINGAGDSRPVTSSTIRVPRPKPLTPSPTTPSEPELSTPSAAPTGKPVPSLS